MERTNLLKELQFQFKVNPIVAILGPRQCGKTTAAKQYLAQLPDFAPQNYFDLENSLDLERLHDPLLTLKQLTDLIVIDEIQLVKQLFPTLRVLVDEKPLQQQYLILGSASRDLILNSSETLAGRISYVELTPFSYLETHALKKLWLRGGYPKSYLADDEAISYAWRQSFIKTFLEQDIPKLGINIPSENLRRLWMMLAHYHGNIFNASELGRSLGLSNKTITHYVDILTGTFMIRQLKPWHENLSKRQVKSPKILIRDSGILHTLLGIKSESDLLLHPKLGASWECLAIEEIIRYHKVDADDCYFWATYQDAELDLLIIKDGKKLGFEIKYASTPKFTKSMRIAMQDLKLDSLTVIYPGNITFPLTDKVTAVGLENYLLQ